MTEPLEARLIRLAEAATPGPWHIGKERPLVDVYSVEGWWVAHSNSMRSVDDAAFIAALSPSTVILLARVVGAGRKVRDFLDDPNDQRGGVTLAISLSPAESLRRAAEGIERKSAAVQEFRAAYEALDASQEENRP